MKITKVMFVGLISLLCSINSFTNTNSENDFKKYVLEKLEEIKKLIFITMIRLLNITIGMKKIQKGLA